MSLDEDEIIALGKDINDLEDRLSAYIKQYESKFNAMNLSVRTWMMLGDSTRSIGYDKVDGKFGLFYRYDEESKKIPLCHVILSERYGAARKLQELEANHIKNAKKFAKNLRKFLEDKNEVEIENTENSVVEALNKVV